ncbi:hypothetical protein Slin14017_G097460 [Septoria linicola]|nr:hypothetical protein Slin14017_G097460 [Septoria linicola]
MRSASSRWRALFDRTAALSAEQNSKAQLDNAFWNAVTHSSEGAKLFDDDDAQLCVRLMGPDSSLSARSLESGHADMVRILESVAHNYDIFLTAKGYLGRVPKGNAEVGDCLIILVVAPSPFCAANQHTAGIETYALRAPCILLPSDTNPDGGELDGTNPIMNGGWLLEQAGLESLLDVHEAFGKIAVHDFLHEIMIC